MLFSLMDRIYLDLIETLGNLEGEYVFIVGVTELLDHYWQNQ